MTEKYVSQSLKRLEDPKMITGQVHYLDDIELPNMMHAAFKRSDFAHAKINSIDVSEARKLPGVIGVWTAEDLGDYVQAGPLAVPTPTAIEGSSFAVKGAMPIAVDKVRYQGEPLAVVLAESRYIAEDALDYIYADVEPLDVVGDLEKAMQSDSPLVHDDLDSNMAGHVVQERGDYAAAAAEADVVINKKFNINRLSAASMETRGIVVDWDDAAQQMTIWCGAQSVIALRNVTASRLGLFESQVRVISPYVGGAFGPKVMVALPDDVLLTYLSMQLKRPVKWVEDRRENFLASTSERDQIHFCEIALKKDGTVLGFKDVFLHNTGAYDPYMCTIPLNTQTHTTSNYLIPNFYTEFTNVFTNQMITSPVRGAGRNFGVYAMERMMDAAAKELNMDVVEIRMKNLKKPDVFPYRTGIIGQDFVEGVLDSGNYPEAIKKTADMVEYEKFRKEIQPKLRAEGKKVGIGVVAFTEGTGVGPYEGAKVTVGGNGMVTITTAYTTHGQGHYTTFAQIVADQVGVDIKNVRVITGDTGFFGWGVGTFASRGMAVAGIAVHNAAKAVREKALKLGSKHLNVPEEELEIEHGVVRVADIPDQSITLGELATIANPMRGTIDPDTDPGLEAVSYYGPPYAATGAGGMALIVEIDPETMLLTMKNMVLVHDCGKVVNPMIVEGQLHGGIQMGIGDSFYEELIYDDYGQMLSATFMDYLFPTASDMPEKLVLGHLETPSPLNPLGVKGVGEAGCIPVGPALCQAIEDAFPEYNLDITFDTLSPSRIFELIKEKKAG